MQPQRPSTPHSKSPSNISTSKSQPQTRTHSQSQLHSKSPHHHKHHSESQLQSQPQTGPTIHESPQQHHQDQYEAQFQSQQQQSQSLTQSQQSLQPQPHTTTLPPPPQQMQTQPNLMSSNNVVQRTTHCYDTNSINLETDLINNSLTNQIQATNSQNQNAAQMSIDFVKSHSDQSSQSLLTHHSNANNSHLSSEADNRLVADKLAALQEDLNFLTETANDCERSQVHEMANQNISKCHQITLDSSTNLTSDESNNCRSTTTTTSLCDSNTSTTFSNKSFLSLDMKLASTKRSKNDIVLDNDKAISETMSKSSNDLINCENSLTNSNDSVKKKKKHKEAKTKLNGQKASKLSKKRETVMNPLIDMVAVDSEKTNKNLDRSLSNSKLYNTFNSVKKSNEFEAKFFKIRPVPNSNNSHSTTAMSTKSDKANDKKRKIKETASNVTHDEYEFPDSPETFGAKKSKKSYSENSKKKGSEKLTVSNLNPLNKKSNSSSKTKISPLGNGSHSKLKEKNDNLKPSRTTNQMINCGKVKPTEDKISKSQTTFSNNHCQLPNKVSKEKVKQRSLNLSSQSENLENSFKRHSTSRTLNQGLSTATATTTASTTTNAATTSNNATLSLTPSSLTITMAPASIVQTFIPVTVTSTTSSFKSASSTSVSTFKSTTTTTSPAAAATTTTTTTTMSSSSLTVTSTTAVAASTTTTTATTQSTKPNTSVSMHSAGTNTPRRRSQDKKASTIREGLMRTSDFVISLDEVNCELPMIWRIEGKSLLQRFEPTEQNGNIVYINTSSVSIFTSLLQII